MVDSKLLSQPSHLDLSLLGFIPLKLSWQFTMFFNETKPDPPPRNGCVWQKRTQRDRDGEFGAAVKPSQGTIVYPTISTKCPQALTLTVNTHACHYRNMYKWYILSPEAGRKLENRKTTIAHLVFFPFSGEAGWAGSMCCLHQIMQDCRVICRLSQLRRWFWGFVTSFKTLSPRKRDPGMDFAVLQFWNFTQKALSRLCVQIVALLPLLLCTGMSCVCTTLHPVLAPLS